jgi:hypothetical protein
MKNTNKPFGHIARTFGIIALAAVIAFSMTALTGCPTDDGGGGEGGGFDAALWAQLKGEWVKDGNSSISVKFYEDDGDGSYCFEFDNTEESGMAWIDSLQGGVVSYFEGQTFNVAVANGKLTISQCKDMLSMEGAYTRIGGGSGNQTPEATDYTFGNMVQTAGSVIDVTITKKSTASPGTISNIKYNGSATIPQTIGNYPVTFDVAAAEGWDAVAGLNAGTLVVNNNQTPLAEHYTFGNLTQDAGGVIAVTVTPKSTASPGTVSNIRYAGNTAVPQTAGTYAVTFDVAAAAEWNAATLSAGTLLIGGITLIIDTWADGSIASGSEQWFKFTATAATQYIHFQVGTLSSVYVQLYDTNSTAVGDRVNLYTYLGDTNKTVNIGSDYYIRVTPRIGSGTYQIGFNASTTQPSS